MEKINEIKQAENMLCMSECVWEQIFDRPSVYFTEESMTQNTQAWPYFYVLKHKQEIDYFFISPCK